MSNPGQQAGPGLPGDLQTPLGITPTTGQIAVDQQRNQMLASLVKTLVTLIQSNGLVITSSAPPLDTSPGVAGTIAYDATHIYICVATNTWRRVAVSTF